MKTLRTPDDRFAHLPGYDFEPHYADVADPEGGTVRVHYLREGDPGGPVVLLLHGEPSWSYLYRTMIPVLTGAGLQIVAPDLVGFGRSDKPAERGDYTFARHVEWMRELLFDRLDLHDVTLVCQDWGGLIGLRLVGEHPDRFARVVAANTFLPTGDTNPGEAFFAWQRFSQEVEQFPTGGIVRGGCAKPVSPEVEAAYDVPFPDESYKAGRAGLPHAGAVAARRPRARRQRRRLGGSGRLRPPVPVCLQRRRPHHQGGGPQPEGEDPRGTGPAPHHDRRGRALPPGGLRGGVGRGRRRLRLLDAVTHDHRVVIVGAGFSGVGMAARLRSMGIDDFVVLDRGNDLGGTWRDNSYPGAACDVPSNLYSYSFALNPDWTRAFSSQSEIWDYLRDCVDRFEVGDHLRVGRAVDEARWDDAAERWTVRTTGGEEYRARCWCGPPGH